MPAMPRQASKATKIAYQIIGVPQNLKGAKLNEDGVLVTPHETMGVGSKIDKRLTFEETTRVR